MKAIVVAGGSAAPGDAAQLSGADLVIAADSGAAWLAAEGMRPDLVVGDMDSIDPALLERPMLEEQLDKVDVPYIGFKYAENSAQTQPVREQAGTFADSIKLWSAP